MRSKILFAAALAAAVSARAGEGAFRVKGEVAEDGVVAVPLTFDVYRACGFGEGRLGRELRVRDSKGVAQPHVIRRTYTAESFDVRHVIGCAIGGLAENADGSISLTASFPEPDTNRHVKVTEIEIDTPLRDFEQFVTVSDAADGAAPLVRDRIYDYSRFAQVRKVTVAVPDDLPRKFKLTFAKPVTEVERREFERIVQTGATTNQTIRRAVTEQPFRVTGLRAGWVTKDEKREMADYSCVTLPGGERGEDRFEYETFSAPVVGYVVEAGAANWDVDVVLGGYRDRCYRYSLPGKREEKREMRVAGGLDRADGAEDGVIRLAVDRKGSPKEALGGVGFTFKMEGCEVVFAAAKGEAYTLGFERGAAANAYPKAVTDYLNGARDVRRLALEQTGDFAAPRESRLSGWLKANGVTAASVIVLVALVFFCLKMFGKAGAEARQPENGEACRPANGNQPENSVGVAGLRARQPEK